MDPNYPQLSEAIAGLHNFDMTKSYKVTAAASDHWKRQSPAHGAVPFGQMANYGANGVPTVTLTKTLFSAGATTSTRIPSPSSSSSQGTTASSQLSLSASPRIGVVADGNGIDGNRIVTLTRVSTIFSTLTVTSTSTLTTSSSASETSADSIVESASGTKTGTALATSTFPPDESNSSHSGKVAGSVIGTFAAFGMIGFLVWYFCVKKNDKEKLKVGISLRRRKSSTPKTPQLEEQSMEETRTVMLQRSAESIKSKDNVVNAFLATSTDHNKPMSLQSIGLETPRRFPAGRPSTIGIAMTSSTPPNTPPLPRSNSQRSNMTTTSMSPSDLTSSHPTSLMPGLYISHAPRISQAPTPLQMPRKPAPIMTAHIPAPHGRSPLSPKAMFNALGSSTNKAWRRASQALSPSAYQRLPPDSHSVFQIPKRRDSQTPRNGEMEIGAQTDIKDRWI